MCAGSMGDVCVFVCGKEGDSLWFLKVGCLVKGLCSVCFHHVCFKESCEGVCRWLNLTLYNSSGTAQLPVIV